MANDKLVVGGVCACIWAIITIALLATSWAVVTPQQLGLKWDNVFLKLDDEKVYQAGRYYVNVGGSFKIFPRKLNYVEFTINGGTALDCWTQDGQQMTMEASFYYKLREDKIHDIYYTWGDDYSAIVRGMASECVRDVSTRFDTLEFFTNRSAIDDAMSAELAARLYSRAHAQVTLFNVLGIDVPDDFDAAIIDKVTVGQEVLTQEKLRLSLLIRSDITVAQAAASANITLINQRATSEGLLIAKRTEAQLAQELLAARASQLKTLSDGLGFTSPREMVKYVYSDVLRASHSGGSSGTQTFVQQGIDKAVLRM